MVRVVVLAVLLALFPQSAWADGEGREQLQECIDRALDGAGGAACFNAVAGQRRNPVVVRALARANVARLAYAAERFAFAAQEYERALRLLKRRRPDLSQQLRYERAWALFFLDDRLEEAVIEAEALLAQEAGPLPELFAFVLTARTALVFFGPLNDPDGDGCETVAEVRPAFRETVVAAAQRIAPRATAFFARIDALDADYVELLEAGGLDASTEYHRWLLRELARSPDPRAAIEPLRDRLREAAAQWQLAWYEGSVVSGYTCNFGVPRCLRGQE